MIGSNDIVLFQGDSITDAGRDRNQICPNLVDGLGRGYVFLVAATLLSLVKDGDLQIFNRGIGGHGIADLRNRWDNDCLALRPTVLSILIGINDVVASVNAGQSDQPHLERFECDYRALLLQTRRSLPGIRLVICKPFVLRCGKVKESWLPLCAARGRVACELAEEFGATLVDFQQAFDEALNRNPKSEYWAYDGVHPTVAGHGLMARFWLEGTESVRAITVE